MKQIAVVIRSEDLLPRRAAEALRVSIGLTLCDNRVQIVFMDGGVNFLGGDPEKMWDGVDVDGYLENLSEVACKLYVERESLKERCGSAELLCEANIIGRDEVIRMLSTMDRVLCF